MEFRLPYLLVLLVYFGIILAIGTVRRKQGYGAYLVAERRLTRPFAVGTFLATFLSSATVIGFVGYTTLYGVAVFPTYFWGFGLAWITLVLIAGRMRRLKLSTVPELFQARFQSTNARSLAAVFIVVSFVFSVMTQLVAGSIVIEAIVGIPQVIALIAIAGILTVYTVLGGLTSVVKTDFVQSGLLSIAVLAGAVLVVSQLGWDVFRIDEHHARVFGGSVSSSWDMLAFLLIAWGGVSAQPYYLHRFYAAKDVATARQMIGLGAVLASVLFIAVTLIGLGLPKLIPEDKLGDAAMPFFAVQAGGILGALLLVGITCAIQSTVDSALHLAGVYLSEDIVARYRTNMTQRDRLAVARAATVVMGMLCTIGAVYFVVIGGGYVVTLLNLWLGTLSSALLIPMLAALFWRRATALGAMGGGIGGFVTYFGTALTQTVGVDVTVNPIFVGLLTSLLLVVGLSYSSRPAADNRSGSHIFDAR